MRRRPGPVAYSRPEQSGAQSNESRALFDGDLEIVAHSHGELPSRETSAEGLSAELPETAKVRSNGFGIGLERRQYHQPVDPEAPKSGQVLERRKELDLREAKLRRLAGEIHLNQHRLHLADFLGGAIDLVAQLDAIEGVDAVKEGDGLLHLVLLQVPHQVPLGRGPIASLECFERWDLLFRLLYPVLPDVGDARLDRGGHFVDGAALRHGDQRDVRGGPPRAAAGALHPIADGGETRGDLHVKDDGRSSECPAKSVRVQLLYAHELRRVNTHISP